MFEIPTKERILLHLADHVDRQLSQKEDIKNSVIFSQTGIEEHTGSSHTRVSEGLKNLEKKDLIERKKSYVMETGRFRNLYFLTAEGIQKAKELQGEIGKTTIKVRKKDKIREMKISDLIQYLKKTAKKTVEINYTNIIKNITADGFLDIRTILEPKKYIDYSEKRPEIKYFVGREKELREINDFMKAKTKILCVKGIAGIGKTTLLSKFVENLEMNIFWHRFYEFSSLENLFTKLAEFLLKMSRNKLKNYLDTGRLEVDEILIILEEELKGSNSLFIFDDVQKVSKEITAFLSAFKDIESDVKTIVIGREIPHFYDRRDVVIKKNVTEMVLAGLDKKSSEKLLRYRKIEKGFDSFYNLTKGHPLLLELILPETTADAEEFIKKEIIKKLDENERKAVEIASVFRYPFPSGAMIKGLSYEILDTLVDKSLMRRSGEIYDLHDMIRDFVYNRLSETKRSECHRVAAEYYEKQKGDHAIIEAIYHYIKGDDYEKAVGLVTEHADRLITRGYAGEFVKTLSEFDEKKIKEGDLAKIKRLEGDCYHYLGDFDKSIELYQSSLKIKHGESEEIAKCHIGLGEIYCNRAEYELAREHIEKALKIFDEKRDLAGIGEAYYRMGKVCWRTGKLNEATKHLKNSLKILEETENESLRAKVLMDIGIVTEHRGEYKKALEYKMRSLKISEEQDNKYEIVRAYNNIGSTYYRMDDLERAIEWAEKEIVTARKIGNIRFVGYGLANNAYNFALLNRQLEKAKEYNDEALNIFARLRDKRMIGNCYETYGMIYHKMKEWSKGIEYFERTIKIFGEVEDLLLLSEAYMDYGKMLADKGDKAKAREQFEKSIAYYEKLGNKAKVEEVKRELELLEK